MQDKTAVIDKLIRYVQGKLKEPEKARFEQQLESDSHLRELLTLVTELVQQRQETGWNELQRPAHKLLERLLKDIRKSRGADKPIYGITTYDSGLLPLPEGIRPIATDTRRLKYNVGEWRLVVSLSPVSPGSYELIGQLEDYDGPSPLTVILKGNKRKLTTKANEFHVFRFKRVVSFPVTIQFEFDNQVIAIAELDI